MLILFIFIVFMQNLPQSCTAGFSSAGFWVAGAATFGPSRRARHERRAGGVQMRNSSAERSRPRGGSGGKSASSRKGVFAFHGRLLDPSGSVGAALKRERFNLRSRKFQRKERTARRKRPSARRGAPRRKKELPTKTVNSSEKADCSAKKPALRRACVSGDCPRGEGRAFSARFPGRPALRA